MAKNTAKYQHILATAKRITETAASKGVDVLICSKATPTGAIFSVVDKARKAVIRRYELTLTADHAFDGLALTWSEDTAA